MNEEPTVSWMRKIINKLSTVSKKAYFVVFLGIAVFTLGAWLTTLKATLPNSPSEEYTLVPEKISASAAIRVQLPEDIALANFDPAA